MQLHGEEADFSLTERLAWEARFACPTKPNEAEHSKLTPQFAGSGWCRFFWLPVWNYEGKCGLLRTQKGIQTREPSLRSFHMVSFRDASKHLPNHHCMPIDSFVSKHFQPIHNGSQSGANDRGRSRSRDSDSCTGARGRGDVARHMPPERCSACPLVIITTIDDPTVAGGHFRDRLVV